MIQNQPVIFSKKIQITGDVNTAAPGTYELTYYVVDNSGNSSNGAVLTVVGKIVHDTPPWSSKYRGGVK